MASTKAQIKRSRLLADALRSEAMSTAPVGHWTQGLARVLDGAVAGVHDRRADKMEGERSQQLAQALSGGMSPSEMRNYGAVNDFQDELFPMADRREDQQNWQAQFDYGKTKDERDFGYRQGRDTVGDNQWGQQFNAEQGWKEKGFGLQQDQFGLEQDKFDWQKNAPPDPTSDMREYDLYSQQERAAGRQPVSFFDYQTGIKRAGATSITNSVSGESSTLNKELDKAEAGEWSDYRKGAVSGARIMQSMEALDALSQSAPQGPISGRLVEIFPGFSSAGDAFTSVTSELAPSLRTPGSGSTSDIEYEGMLKSLPRLRNSPGGNQIISGIMKAKAQINIDRGKIVDAYRVGDIDANSARQKLGELNQRSIMTPEIKSALGITSPVGADAPQPDIGLDAVEQELRRRGQQ